MRSSLMPDRYFIECACNSPEHLLVFDLWLDNKEENNVLDISVQFTSNWNMPFYKRIWLALKYIFIKKSFPVGDSVVITSENIHQLQEAIERIYMLRNEDDSLNHAGKLLKRMAKIGISTDNVELYLHPQRLITEILDKFEEKEK